MKWENINISPERLNGLKFKANAAKPSTTPPKLLDHILEQNDIPKLSNEQLAKLLKGVIVHE
jgi:hypothetical protein